jgi:hypothetical protein
LGSRIDVWLHVGAFAAYAIATAALLLIGVPLIHAADPADRARRAAAVLRLYDPFSLAALGTAIMTGAFNLTAYKAALGARFFDRLGPPLAWKLLYTFLLINVATYIAFGIGHRLVRAVDFGEAPDPQRLGSMLRRLVVSAVLALVLLGVIWWEATRLTSAALAAASI